MKKKKEKKRNGEIDVLAEELWRHLKGLEESWNAMSYEEHSKKFRGVQSLLFSFEDESTLQRNIMLFVKETDWFFAYSLTVVLLLYFLEKEKISLEKVENIVEMLTPHLTARIADILRHLALIKQTGGEKDIGSVRLYITKALDAIGAQEKIKRNVSRFYIRETWNSVAKMVEAADKAFIYELTSAECFMKKFIQERTEKSNGVFPLRDIPFFQLEDVNYLALDTATNRLCTAFMTDQNADEYFRELLSSHMERFIDTNGKCTLCIPRYWIVLLDLVQKSLGESIQVGMNLEENVKYPRVFLGYSYKKT